MYLHLYYFILINEINKEKRKKTNEKTKKNYLKKQTKKHFMNRAYRRLKINFFTCEFQTKKIKIYSPRLGSNSDRSVGDRLR